MQAPLSRDAHLEDYLYKSLKSFPLQGKRAALLAPMHPWYESILLSSGAESIDLLSAQIPPTESFDAIVLLCQLKSLAVAPHSNADLEMMSRLHFLLKKSGLLYLSIPVGKEKIVDNSYRVYGEKRMKELFRGWRPVGYFGYSYEDLLKDPEEIHEPIFVLRAGSL